MASEVSDSEKRAIQAEDLPAFRSLKLLNLRTKISEIVSLFGRNNFFEEYTKHDISHLNEMLKNYDWMLEPQTKEIMSPADWMLLVCATYLHDVGLIVTRDEFDNRSNSKFDEYREAALRGIDNESRDYQAYLKTLNDKDRERFLYQEFVRTNHAARIRSWLQDRPDPALGYDPALSAELKSIFADVEPVFVSDLGIACESHHRDDLHDVNRYPTSRPYGNSDNETANVQFIAIALRAADLLHITKDRAPAIAFRLINPSNPYSQVEWAKQSAVRTVRARMGRNREGEIDPNASKDTVEIHAEFRVAEGFFGLGSYITYAEKQLQQCNAWATYSNQKYATPHRFPWRHIDKSHIEAHGFIASQFEFTLDQPRILDLLTGHTLYNDSSVVIRELVQNSLDAVRLQAFAQKCQCSSTVNVHWSSKSKILEVIDNGTGMTQQIIEQNFLRVGASRYQERSFKREFPGFSPISRFGIGVLSTFMVSDEVQVVTCNPDEDSAREISLRSVHGQYLVRLIDKNDPHVPELIRAHGHGTSVKIRIRPSAELADIARVLDKWIVIPRAEISFTFDDQEPRKIGFARLEDALRDIIEDPELNIKPYAEESEQESNPIEIRTVESDGIRLVFAVQWNPYFKEWNFYRPMRGLESQRPDRSSISARLGICVEGVRVESGCPGFSERDISILAMADVSGSRAPKTNVARTALENTPELDDFLFEVYKSYCVHLKSEADAIVSKRGFSTTKAAIEMQYLSMPLRTSNKNSRNERLLVKALRQIPAYVKEFNNARQLASIADMEECSEFVTLDSRMIRRVEYLLAELPGGITLQDISNLSGGSLHQEWEPDVPRLCTSQWGFFHELLHIEWEPGQIDVDNDGVLRIKWIKRNSRSRWTSQKQLVESAISKSIFEIFEFNPGLLDDDILDDDDVSDFEVVSIPGARRLGGADVYFPAESISVSGLDSFDAVKAHGNRYILPQSRFMSLEVGAQYKDEDKLAAMSAIMHVSSEMYGTRRDWLRNRLRARLRRLNIGTITAEALTEAASYQLRVFDISNWERENERS